MRVVVVGGVISLALAAAAALLVPRLIASARLRERLVTELSAQLGAQVDLDSLRMALLPLPHVVLDELRLSAPTVDVTVESASVYPGLRALLTGTLQLAEVDIVGAQAELRSTGGAAVEAPAATTTPRLRLRDAVRAALATTASVAAARAPGLALRLTHGSLSVAVGDEEPIVFTEIHGTVQLPPEQLSVDLVASSNLWEQAALRGSIDPVSVHGDGRLTLAGMRPQVIGHYLMPADLELGSATASLDARLTSTAIDAWRANIEATAPQLPLQRGGAQLTLKGAHVKASLTVEGENIGIAFDSVQLAAPPTQLSATLALNRATPQARLEVEGKDLDVANAHEAAVFFAGHNRTARAIFDVLQGGKVPQLTLQAEGRTLADLGSLDAMLIRGALVDGQVRLPGSGLELADVSGAVSVVKSVLIGEHAAGRVGNTYARDGSVRVGLTDESNELAVSTAVRADVSDLPAVLEQVVDSESLNRVLAQLTDVQGTAEGQLTLGGSTDGATATVDVAQLSVSAHVRDLAQPVRVTGGQFHYNPDGIAATDLTVVTGASTLAGVALRFDTSAPTARIDISGANGRIALNEIHPWVLASGWLAESAWTPTTLAGTLRVDSLTVRGPAARPALWQIALAGAVPKLDVDSARLRQVTALGFPVAVSDLRVTHDPGATRVLMGVAAPGGLKATVDVAWDAKGVDLKRLTLRDSQSNATLALQVEEREFELAFAGNLTTQTLKALLHDEHDVPHAMRGDFRVRIPLDQPIRSTAKGRLEVFNVALPGPGDLRVDIAQANLRAAGGVLAIDAQGDVNDGPLLQLRGNLRPATDAVVADLDLVTGPLEGTRLATLFSQAGDGNGRTGSAHLPLRGKVRIAAASFTYGGYTWQPVRAVVDVSGAAPVVTIAQANLCGIATPGKIAVTADGVSLQFKPAVTNQPIDQILKCLSGGPSRITGRCTLAGQIDASGRGPQLLTTAYGQLQFNAKSGRIYQGGGFEKVLAVMSVGHGSWNLLSDLTDDGLPYNTIDVKGELRDGKLVLTEATMDAPSMKMVGEGNADLKGGTVDVTLLAAPLKTVDMVVSRIPILGHVLGGNLLTIPIKVKGPLQDPSVTPLDPSDVGSGLLRVMTRIVKLPLTLLDPFLPARDKQ